MRRVLGTAMGTAIVIDVLRVFLPSLITIFGQAGATPAEQIGLFALAWFLGPFVTAGLARLVDARRLLVGCAVLLVGGRAALQFTAGGPAQLYLASAALLAGLCWLTATAIADPDARGFATGLVWGFAIATGLHAALDTVDLMWRTGLIAVPLLAVELLLFLAATLRPAVPGEPAGAGRAWLAAGPALLLWGMYAGNTAHAQASDGWAPVPGAIVVTVAGFLATAFVAQPRRFTGHPVVPAVGLLASAAAFAFGQATVGGVHGIAPWWVVLAQVIGALALAASLGWAATTKAATKASTSGYRRGLAAAAGLLLFVIFTFAYYAAYDLGVPNDYVPVTVAVIVATLGLVRVRTARELAGVRIPLVAGASAVVAALAVAAVPLWNPPGTAAPQPGGELRVAAYNIRMGFGLDGRLSLREQAETLRGLQADVIALSEVDRAWLLNGGHDDLRLIAHWLGMSYVWAPAADEVWGDALLTNLPVTSVRNHPLVRGGPTGAQTLEVGLRWRNQDLTVIVTHLQPPTGWRELDQVQQLASIVRAAPKPTIVAGDLNLEPGEPAYQVLLDAGLSDPFPPGLNTMPSPRPFEQIDHILVTPDLRGQSLANPDVPYSDHRPIAVTLTPLGAILT